MPEDLDPTTARLVAELAASILPALTKSLSSAVPSADFSGLFDRISRSSQDTQAQIERVIRADIEENRAGRSVIMQSLGNVLDDVATLRRSVEKLPAPSTGKAQPQSVSIDTSEITRKLDAIYARLDVVIHGFTSFAEAYAHTMEQRAEVREAPVYSHNEAQLEKLVTQSLPGLEGFVRANAKSQSQELEDFSREISALHEQNSKALVHEVSRNVSGEVARYGEEMLEKLSLEREGQFRDVSRMTRMAVILSGACAVMSLIAVVMMLFR